MSEADLLGLGTELSLFKTGTAGSSGASVSAKSPRLPGGEKFSTFFASSRRQKWILYYVEYSALRSWMEQRMDSVRNKTVQLVNVEKEFRELVETEVEKVNGFFLKAHERIMSKLDSLRVVLVSKSARGPRSEDSRDALVGQIDHLDSQLNSLWLFCWMNHLAVWKLMKYHDKVTGLIATPWCMQITEQKPFYSNSGHFGIALVRFSECCARLRTVITGQDEADLARPVDTTGSQSFTRQTVKYWVETRDLMKVKNIITRHLPLYLFDPKKATRDWALISSVYYDDPATMQLYEGRLKKLEGAIAVRMRTYEGSEQEVFVERKTHHENWAWGENSVKERFSLPESDVFDFATSKYNENDFRQRIAEQGLGSSASEKALSLFREVESQFKTFQLAPAMTTEYKRTAFQIPGNAAVRISLDTDLTFIRESLRLDLSEGRWRKAREDVRPADVHVFPYAILEVKIETAQGAEPPQWILDLTNSPLVRVMHHFSKYIHGCARLLPNSVNCFPEWIDFPDLRHYIDHPDLPRSLPVDGRLRPCSFGGFTGRSWTNFLLDGTLGPPAPPSDEDEDDDDNSYVLPTHRRSDSSSSVELKSMVAHSPSRRRRTSNGGGGGGSGSPDNEDNDDDEQRSKGWFRCLSITDRQYKGRPIIPRIKIEPKTYFANERTFLRWMSLCIMLEGIGVALLSIPNFSNQASGTNFAGISGCVFIVVSIFFMGYALYMHRWRARAIAAASSTRFDDVFGPVALFMAIVSAAIVNMIIYLNNLTTLSTHT